MFPHSSLASAAHDATLGALAIDVHPVVIDIVLDLNPIGRDDHKERH